MTEYNISRRKVLAGLGTIGVASAGAGLGTTAFFSDEEELEASLEAGRMDILLDYRATYSPWEPYLDDVYPRSPDVQVFDPDDDPQTDNSIEGPIYVTGQAPDIRDDDGDIVAGQRWGDVTLNLDACVDVQNQLDGAEEGSILDNVSVGPADYPNFEETYIDGLPGTMFSLDDVKPKDRGEATMSVHLCDNRAYLWTRPTITMNDENQAVEPETSLGDAVDDESDDFDGELADHLWVSVWYDANCNNVKDREQGASSNPVSVQLVLDDSGSMSGTKNTETKNGATQLATSVLNANANNEVGVTFFNAGTQQALTTDESLVTTAISNLPASGSTPMADGIDDGKTALDNAASGNDQIMILLSDGEPASNAASTTAADAVKNAGYRLITLTITPGADPAFMESLASSPADAFVTGQNTIAEIFDAISEEIIGGEVCIYEGTLAGLVDYTDRMGGVPLEGDAAARENCVVNAAEDVACFDPGVHCFAFEWYLPCFMEQDDSEGYNQLPSCYGDLSFRAAVNAGNADKTMYDELVERGVVPDDGTEVDVNVVQTDHLDFGVEYSAIQCRHRMGNVNPFGSQSA
jgi:predicted ribosomally synthesized peptide with SipW-like signal peptide